MREQKIRQEANKQRWQVLDANGTIQKDWCPSKYAAKHWINIEGKAAIEYKIRRVNMNGEPL